MSTDNNSAKVIAEKIIWDSLQHKEWEVNGFDMIKVARAYLELEKKYEQQINYIERVLIPTNKLTTYRMLEDKSQILDIKLGMANKEITKLREVNKILLKQRNDYRDFWFSKNVSHQWEKDTIILQDDDEIMSTDKPQSESK